MDTTAEFPDWRTHEGFNLDPPGHVDAAQSIVTSGNKQTADRSSFIQALDSCDHLEQATYSFSPLAAFDTRHHATPPIHQGFQQEHSPLPALANASIQPDIAMDMSIVQPYAGLNPSGDVLEHCKEEIAILYASNTLKAVREEINSKYHLKASSKMYKDRISKWGYKKNLKAAEKDAIIRKQIQRSHAAKDSEFEIRNIRNLPSKLSRHRKNMNLRTDQQALALRATTPPDVPSPPLRMPREFEISELVARAMREHVCGMLDSGAWHITKTSITVTLDNRNPTVEPSHALKKLEFSCRNARHALRRKRSTQAFKWLNISLSMAEHILRGQRPLACSAICSALRVFWSSRTCRPITSTMLKQFAALSTVVLGRGHPCSVLFDSLLHTNDTTIEHNLALRTKVEADIFTQKVGKLNGVSLNSHRRVAESMRDVNQKIDFYSRLVREIHDTLGSDSLRYQDACLDLADKYLSAKEYQKAAELAETVVDDPTAANHMYRCNALLLLARAQYRLCQNILAEKNMRDAIRISAEELGWEDARTLRLMSRFGCWLEDWGRAEDAASVRRDYDNDLVSMFDKLRLEEEERFQRHGITDASVS